jgi:uncharacterized protein
MNEQSNSQVIQTAYECFGRGDVPGILTTLTDDVTWHVAPVENAPYTGTRHGKAGAADFFATMAASEDTLKFEPREFIAQDDKVVVVGHYEGKAKPSGRVYETYFIHVFTLQAGQIVSFREYTDTAAVQQAFMKAQAA